MMRALCRRPSLDPLPVFILYIRPDLALFLSSYHVVLAVKAVRCSLGQILLALKE
jgi:hypothetical protein